MIALSQARQCGLLETEGWHAGHTGGVTRRPKYTGCAVGAQGVCSRHAGGAQQGVQVWGMQGHTSKPGTPHHVKSGVCRGCAAQRVHRFCSGHRVRCLQVGMQQCSQQLVSKLGQMEKAIEIFGQGMPKKPIFSWVSGLRPRTSRRVVKQLSTRAPAGPVKQSCMSSQH